MQFRFVIVRLNEKYSSRIKSNKRTKKEKKEKKTNNTNSKKHCFEK